MGHPDDHAGHQWYVLFNVIAGVSAIPTQLTEVSETFGLRRFRWWRYYMLPAIFPYIVTGIISAAGGTWNSAIAAEVIQWGSTTLSATGLGAFISVVTDAGKNPESALGCAAVLRAGGAVHHLRLATAVSHRGNQIQI